LASTTELKTTAFLDQTGRWLVESGIQEKDGGVARYYRADVRENRPVSTEITGYAVSTFTYLFSLTGNPLYLESAGRAASFLKNEAWDPALEIFPFECAGSERLAYFFDCGIIIRGLLSLWRVAGATSLLDIAKQCGRSMATSFAAPDSEFHPILYLPDKRPFPRSDQWSRLPGCYQLKSGLAWHDLYKETGEVDYLNWYEAILAWSLRTHESFLPGADDDRVMDRLHAYCYFLEAILPRVDRPEVAATLTGGIEKVSRYLSEIGPRFARSDVYAQLLRLRLLAEAANVAPVDRLKASAEARILASFQDTDQSDPRIRGGFYFGKRGGQLQPHVNPVSTGFALQALVMWRQYLEGNLEFSTGALI